MPETTSTTAEEAKRNAKKAIEDGEKSFAEAISIAEKSLTEAAKRAEKALKESVDTIRSHSRDYAHTAADQLDDAQKYVDEAQRYVVERVKERPVTAALTGLGVGFLLGLLLAGRR